MRHYRRETLPARVHTAPTAPSLTSFPSLLQDYFISKRGFIWDLNVWPDDVANDDPSAPAGTDLKTLEAIMLSAYRKTNGTTMIHVGGFTPWAFKYVSPFGK